MDANPSNDNPGATAPSQPQPQEDLSQTRYFAPQTGQQPQSPPQYDYSPYGNTSTAYTNGNASAAPVPPAAPSPPAPPAAPAPAQFYGNGQTQQPGPGAFNWQQYAGHRDRNRVLWGTILVAVGALFLINQLFAFDGLGSFVLLLIGGIFMYAYLNTRMGYRIGYLIPGSILLGLGVGSLLDDLDVFNLWGGNIVTLTLGLGFCTIWFFERKHWWALIPGGILVLTGLSSILAIGALWPVILIVLGVYLIYDQTRRRNAH